MLTITTTHRPATDLGFLLHKHPDRSQTFKVAYGQATVFYPEATGDRCTAALMLEIDPVAITRRGHRPQTQAIQEYINDRPYAANSHLAVAIAEVFGTALSGRCDHRPELVKTPLPLVIEVTSLHARHAAELCPRLFEPLGYQVETAPLPEDPDWPEWNRPLHYNLTLTSDANTLQAALRHLYVLIPTLDTQKHYWVDDKEVEKLARMAGDWLPEHPERELITSRYLGYHRGLQRQAAAAMPAAPEPEPDDDPDDETPTEATVRGPSLNDARIAAVMEQLKQAGATSVIDLGCGEGKLLQAMLPESGLERIAGLEVNPKAIATAERRLRVKNMTPDQRQRLALLHGSLLYADDRIAGYDAATLVEVIEHIDPSKLDDCAAVVFDCARPATVILTTPNAEYNATFPDHQPGRMRHRDHRFEWTRAEFQDWCDRNAERYGYAVAYHGIGSSDPELGPPTQMAVLTRQNSPETNP